MVYSWNIFLNLTNLVFISIDLTTDNSQFFINSWHAICNFPFQITLIFSRLIKSCRNTTTYIEK